MTVNKNLEGRRVLVTGASSGLGAAICKSIVHRGGSVAMLARRKDQLDELETALGTRAFGIQCDVTDLSALESSIKDAAQRLDGIDAVIAVAGRSMVGSIETGTPQGWRELMDLNLVGPLAATRYALDHFSKSGRRDVILIGSTGAITPMPGVGIYAASKRGLRAAFDAMRLELATSNINASYVMPGMFNTEGMIGALAVNGDMPDSNIPMFVPGCEMGSPDTLGDTVAFMLGLPEGICINEIVIRPTGQLNP